MSHMKRYEKRGPEGRRADKPEPLPESVVREAAAVYRVKQVREGLLFWTFDVLREQLGVTEERLAELLDISRATLHRRKKIGQLDRAESDRLARFQRLYLHAEATFGGAEEARSWLGTPALAFHWETPLDYADTEIGAQAVEQLLGRIEHGIFS